MFQRDYLSGVAFSFIKFLSCIVCSGATCSLAIQSSIVADNENHAAMQAVGVANESHGSLS
ncbi:hypothetical protein D3C73_1600190 [compost metagenome]